MDLTHCEYCGWRKAKYRVALRLRVCTDCLRWLKNGKCGSPQALTTASDDDIEAANPADERLPVMQAAGA